MENRRKQKREVFLELASTVSQLSHCSRLHVGAVLTDLNHERIWIGYNGGPRNGINNCIRDEPGNCGCIHAEVNALIKADFAVQKFAFVTHSPCEKCATVLANSGVVGVWASQKYRDWEKGAAVLSAAGIEYHLER